MRSFAQRECYVNCAEHLLNGQNVNIMFEDAGQRWTDEEWRAFFKQLKAFGYTTFMIWLPPTLAVPGKRRDFAIARINEVITFAHAEDLEFHAIVGVNIIGGEWYFACPNDPKDKAKILEFWEYYARNLKGVDYISIFSGDPGGCNRNGCNHVTFLELCLELIELIKGINPSVTLKIGTWGTPYSGWGGDMRETPNWDGTWAMLTDPEANTPEIPCHIWNGTKERVCECERDTVKMLPRFPAETQFEINVGFNPDSEIVEGYDGRPLANAVAKRHKVCSWDYSASEGELVCYPHWRVAKYKRKRMLDMNSAPYHGAICYTMTPKMSQMMLYCAAKLMIDPDADADTLAGDFTEQVFGDRKIGALMEAFEIVPAWGFEPRREWTKKELSASYSELIERLHASKGFAPTLPIFPSVDEYRDILLWHAEHFLQLVGDNPDRERIGKEYYEKFYEIYKKIPEAADERTRLAAKQYSQIGINLK